MQSWTGIRHSPICLLILLQTELDPQGVGRVQTELRQPEEEAVTFLEMSCSVHPFSCPGFGRRELSLAAQIEISAVEPKTEKPQLLCWALSVLLTVSGSSPAPWWVGVTVPSHREELAHPGTLGRSVAG